MEAQTDLLFIRATNFFSWWCGELANFIPIGLRRVLEAERVNVMVAVSDNKFRLQYQDGPNFKDVSIAVLDDATSYKYHLAFQRTLAELSGSSTFVILALTVEQTLCRTFTLPASAEKNLREIITHEISRRTPFVPEEVYFDVEIRDRSPANETITVALYVTPREAVDQAVAKLDALGLKPSRVTIADEDSTADRRINFLPPPAPSRAMRLERLAATALAIAAVVLLVANIVVPLQRKHALSIRLADQATALRTEIATTSRIERQIDAAVRQRAFIADERKSQPAVIVVMDALTRLLPADTWLFQMHLKDGRVSVQSYTNAVSALVKTIESSPRFHNVAVQSNITRDQKTGQERFHLTLDVADGVR